MGLKFQKQEWIVGHNVCVVNIYISTFGFLCKFFSFVGRVSTLVFDVTILSDNGFIAESLWIIFVTYLEEKNKRIILVSKILENIENETLVVSRQNFMKKL